jgi:hypothetical protein
MYNLLSLPNQPRIKYTYTVKDQKTTELKELDKIKNREEIIVINVSGILTNIANKYAKILDLILNLFPNINWLDIQSEIYIIPKYCITVYLQNGLEYIVNISSSTGDYSIKFQNFLIYEYKHSAKNPRLHGFEENVGYVHHSSESLGFHSPIDLNFCASCIYYDRSKAIYCTVHPSSTPYIIQECKDKVEN